MHAWTMPGQRFVSGITGETSPDDLASVGEGCSDIKGRFILPGHHYVPGPDSCTVCFCDGGKPKWCQAVLCAPPNECKSFRIGNSCCEFICLDNTVNSNEGPAWVKGWASGDSGLWMLTTVVTVVFSLALLVFLVCRLRQRRLNRTRGSATIIGSAASLGTFEAINSTSHLSRQQNLVGVDHEMGIHVNGLYLWKPAAPCYAEATRDAPPPYTEAPATTEEHEGHETVGLLPVVPQVQIQTEPAMILSSTDTLNSDYLGRGTPPPSYSEVIGAGFTNEDDYEVSDSSHRLSLILPTGETSSVSNHRLSLQLPLDTMESHTDGR